MKGLKLAESYYWNIGRPVLKQRFPQILSHLAAGLFGDGSECLEFDDDISQDHDFGPGFCIWLDKEDYILAGAQLHTIYTQLPKEYLGFSSRSVSPYGNDRVGVMEIHEFFSRYIGDEQPPKSLQRWLSLPEEKLAALTSGKHFEDTKGTFTWLQQMLSYYPEDIRLKKLAAKAAKMAQSGQYNYGRCMQRQDIVAANFALNEFLDNAISMIYLLNRTYCPYYKWKFKGLERLSLVRDAGALILELAETDLQKYAWQQTHFTNWNPYLNLVDKKVRLIEEICRLCLEELEKQDLIVKTENVMNLYPTEIIQKIQDPLLREIHILIG